MKANTYAKAYLYMRIVHAKLFMDKCYAQPISLNNITGQAFFSKYHFIRAFSKIYGYTPHQYLRSIRIEKSKQLLKKGLRVSEVCYSVGVESVSSFVGLFKKQLDKH